MEESARNRCSIAPLLILLLGIGLFAIAMIRVIGPTQAPEGDPERYLLLAKSIASGSGYMDNNKPIPTPHVKFPPVFPAILAVSEMLKPDDVTLMKYSIAFFGLLSIVVIFALLRKVSNDQTASIIAATMAIQVGFIEHSQKLLSEIPYIFFSLLALLAILHRTESKTHLVLADLGVAVSICLAMMTRTIGVLLIPAFVVSAIMKKGYKRRIRSLSLVLIIVCVVLGAWNVRTWIAVGRPHATYLYLMTLKCPKEPEQGTLSVSDLLERAGSNLVAHERHILTMALGNLSSASFILPVVLALTAIGFIARLFRRPTVLEWYVLPYGAVLLVWGWALDRFVLAVAPLVLFFFFEGTRLSACWLHKLSLKALRRLKAGASATPRGAWDVAKTGRAAALAIGVLILVWSLGFPISLIVREDARDSLTHWPRWWGSFRDAGMWITETLPEDTVVLTERPIVFYLLTGLKAFDLDDYKADKMLADAAGKGRLVVIQGEPAEFTVWSERIGRLLQSTAGYWRVAHEVEDIKVIVQRSAGDGRLK